jgi:conserved protein with predicted RNA binding PUA domain
MIYKNNLALKPVPLNPQEKIYLHIDAIFGYGVSESLLGEKLQFEYSKRTGRIKNFSIGSELLATLRPDGGMALTIAGAKIFLTRVQFRKNCVIPNYEALPFVSEGRSLFCKYVEWCGSNVKVGSDVAIIDTNNKVLAVGRALFGSNSMKKYHRGVAVKVREGIKRRIK